MSMTLGNRSFQFNPPIYCCCWAARNSFLAASLRQYLNLWPMSLQYLQDFSGSVVPSLPAASLGVQCMPINFFPVPPLLVSLEGPAWLDCRAVVNACCRAVGLRNSLIWEFSATAWSSLVWRSLICKDCMLIFASFFDSVFASVLFSSGSVSTADVFTVLAVAGSQARAVPHTGLLFYWQPIGCQHASGRLELLQL